MKKGSKLSGVILFVLSLGRFIRYGQRTRLESDIETRGPAASMGDRLIIPLLAFSTVKTLGIG
jgi:hypothetical protein